MSFSSKHTPRKPTLHLKPPPYDFAGERERITTHDARLADARDNQGGRNVCPYCYQPPMRTNINGGWHCGCSRA